MVLGPIDIYTISGAGSSGVTNAAGELTMPGPVGVSTVINSAKSCATNPSNPCCQAGIWNGHQCLIGQYSYPLPTNNSQNWPTLETWGDLYWYAAVEEPGTHLTIAPVAYLWGYLAKKP